MSTVYSWKHVLFILLLCLLITLIWFSNGIPLSGGEESYSIFNNRDILSINGLWENIGTGYLNPTYLCRIPLSMLVRIFTAFGISVVILQAGMYFCLFSIGSVSTYYLARRLTGEKQAYIPLISSLFYLFNTYSTFQIFSRFLYSALFLWGYVPLALYLWVRYYHDGKRRSLVYFLISSVVMSLSYLQPAHIITFWVPIVLWSLLEYRKIYKLFVGFGLWGVVNIWWLYPFIKLKDLAFSEISTYKQNIDTLTSLSQYFNLDQVLTLRQKYIFSVSPWSQYYNQPIIILFGVLLFGILLLGLWKAREYRYGKYVIFTFLVSLFIVKGANPPLGASIYEYMFKYIPATAALRNPYEKFGVVYVLLYSLLIGIGINAFSRKSIKIITPLALIISLCLPMITGEVMRNKQVVLPEYYSTANNWMSQSHTPGRIFHLPPSPGDSVTYTWGYTGVEPGEYLFDRASISKIIRTSYYDDKYKTVVAALDRGENIDSQLEELGVQYILYHRDIEPQENWLTRQKVERYLEHTKYKFIGRVGELEIYSNSAGSNILSLVHSGEIIKIDNPTHRHFVVTYNSMSGNTLVLKSTFNPLWQAYIHDRELPHDLIYGYANAWAIPAGQGVTVDIKLPVWPWE